MNRSFACMYVCMRVLDPLELDLETVVSFFLFVYLFVLLVFALYFETRFLCVALQPVLELSL